MYVLLLAVGALALSGACLSRAVAQPAAPAAGPQLDDFQGPFEGPGDVRWHTQQDDNPLGFVADEAITHGGACSAKWEPDVAGRMVYTGEVPHDWSAWDGLSLWVHSAKPTSSVLALLVYSDSPDTPQWDCYRCLIKIDWSGWRLLQLRRRSFQPCYKPVGWDHITQIGFSFKGWPGVTTLEEGTVLHFADMRALLPEPAGERLTLFDADTDCGAVAMDGPNVLNCVQDPVRRPGGRAGLWASTRDHKALYALSIPHDWSQFHYLNLWLHCAAPIGEGIVVYMQSKNPKTTTDDAYLGMIGLDWQGWKLVSLPLAQMARLREPSGWQQVDRMCLYSDSYGAKVEKGTSLALDQIWLSKTAPTAEQQ
jgi:hypothetical protein